MMYYNSVCYFAIICRDLDRDSVPRYIFGIFGSVHLKMYRTEPGGHFGTVPTYRDGCFGISVRTYVLTTCLLHATRYAPHSSTALFLAL
jgi:hypothetical protein